MTERKLRLGILGAARIAEAYIKAVTDSRNVVVQAVASRSLEKAAAYATKHGIPKAHGSYEALLADPEVDAIYVALPNGLHAEWSIRSAEAGKHVLCEKPLAANAAEGRAMEEAFSKRGLQLSEALMYRRHPLNQKAMALLREGRMGDLVAVHASFFAPVSESDMARHSLELAGGALRDLGSYCVSLARWAAGAEPGQVSAHAVRSPGGADVRTGGSLLFPGGVMATFGCGFGTAFSCMYEFVGTKGRLLADRGSLCAWPGGEFKIQLWSGDNFEEIAIPPANHYQLMAEEFADAVLQGKPLLFPVSDSIANLEVLDRLLACR